MTNSSKDQYKFISATSPRNPWLESQSNRLRTRGSTQATKRRNKTRKKHHSTASSNLRDSERFDSPSKMPIDTLNEHHLLETLTTTAACLMENKKDIEALSCLEQSLWLKCRMFGSENSVVKKTLHDIILNYNSVAIQYSTTEELQHSITLLQKAESILLTGSFSNCQSLEVLTYNNFGCCYRKLGKAKSALAYLQRALNIGSTSPNVKNLSITHLNMCGIHSQLGRHDLALEHAQHAIYHAQEELATVDCMDMEQDINAPTADLYNGAEKSDDGISEDILIARNQEEKVISLAIAYYNFAVELEHNMRGESSMQWYKKALQLASQYREKYTKLCYSLTKSLNEARKKYEKKELNQRNMNDKAMDLHNYEYDSSNATGLFSSVKSLKDQAIIYTEQINSPTPSLPRNTNSYKGLNNNTVRGDSGEKISRQGKSISNTHNSPQKFTTIPTRPSTASSSARTSDAFVKRPQSARPTAQQSREILTAKYEKPSATMQMLAEAIEEGWKHLEQTSNYQGALDHMGHFISKQNKISDTEYNNSASPMKVKHHNPNPRSPSQNAFRNRELIPTNTSTTMYDEPHGELPGHSMPNKLRSPKNANILSPTGKHDTIEHDDRFFKLKRSNQNRYVDPTLELNVETITLPSSSEISTKDYFGEDDEGCSDSQRGFSGIKTNMPSRRASHLEYLRQMKRAAEYDKEETRSQRVLESNSQEVEKSCTTEHTPQLQVLQNSTEQLAEITNSKLRQRYACALQSQQDTGIEIDADYNPQCPKCSPESSIEENKIDFLNVDPEPTTDSVSAPESVYAELNFSDRKNGADSTHTPCKIAIGTVVQIQCWIRSLLAQKKLKDIKEVRNSSAVLFQSQAEKLFHQSRHFCSETIEQDITVATNSSELETPTPPTPEPITLEIKPYKPDYFATRWVRIAAASAIQFAWRNFACRKHFVEAHASSLITNNNQNHELLNLETEVEFRNTCKLKIQAWIIHRLQVLALSKILKQIKLNKLQENCNAQQKASLALKSEAVTIIQATYRGYSARKNMEIKSKSVTTIQATFRGYAARSNMKIESKSVTTIQATYRGYAARKNVKLTEVRHISRSYIERGHMIVQMDHALSTEKEMVETLAATTIQKIVRSWLGNNIRQQNEIIANTAAEIIQVAFRRYKSRCHELFMLGVTNLAATCIQVVFREYKSIKIKKIEELAEQERLATYKCAAIEIQKFWRQQHKRKTEQKKISIIKAILNATNSKNTMHQRMLLDDFDGFFTDSHVTSNNILQLLIKPSTSSNS